VCLDTGHAAVNKNAAELVASLGDVIAHFHVHDNHGARDEHLPIGAGSIDFAPYVPILERLDGMAIAEIVWEDARSAQPPEALARATKDGWSRLLGKSR
jgi:sugar phosphate isomerase/epimerase